MSSWSDKLLVDKLSKRFAEQPAIDKYITLPPDSGIAFGIELLLVSETERPSEVVPSQDPELDAMVAEVRHRIALRVNHGSYDVDG